MTNKKTPREALHDWIFWRDDEMSVDLQINGSEYEARFLRLDSGNLRIKFSKGWGANDFAGFLKDNVGEDVPYAGPLLVTDFVDFTPDQVQENLRRLKGVNESD